jgi:hypothetical protein
MPDLIEKAGGPEQMELLVASEKYPKQPIEADEVVHVGMGDKNMGNPQKLARRERGDVAEIEQEGASLEEKIDKDRRVPQRSVNKGRMEQWLHR